MSRRLSGGLWVAAALWFVPGTFATLDWVDEGHLVYFAWRVSEGALLYRDLHHMYGPGTFFLNGGLFHLFGANLAVVRLALVAVKATLALAVARLADAAGGRTAGLLAWAFVVAVWGTPLWIFASPYASIYQATLDLWAQVALLDARRRSVVRVLIAGVCLGLALTFKQTAGVLAGGGALAFLLWEGTAAPPRPRHRAGTAARLALLAGVVAVVGYYSATFADRRGVLLLDVPLLALLGWTATRVLQRRDERSDLAAVLWMAAGASIAPAAYALYYVAHGAVRDLVHDTVRGLPQELTWRVPLAALDASTAVAGAIVVVALGGVESARRALSARGARRLAYLAAAAIALALVVLGFGPVVAWPAWRWHGAGPPLRWLPIVSVWLAVARLLRGGTPAGFALPTFMAAAVLPCLQPAGDLPHVLLALPMFVAPLAALAASYADRALPGRPLATGAVALIALALMSSFVRQLGESIVSPRTPAEPYAHATWVRDPGPAPEEARALVSYLERTPPDVRVVVLPSAQMVQFLSRRRSALEAEDFGLYAGTYDQVSDETARRLVDQDAVIARLEREDVLVVRVNEAATLRVVARVFPTLLRYVEGEFHPVADFGRYQVLARRVAAGGDGAHRHPSMREPHHLLARSDRPAGVESDGPGHLSLEVASDPGVPSMTLGGTSAARSGPPLEDPPWHAWPSSSRSLD